MFALTLGSRLWSGRKSSRVLSVEMSVVRFFEDFKNADGFGGVHLMPVTGFGSPLSSLINLVWISFTSHL